MPLCVSGGRTESTGSILSFNSIGIFYSSSFYLSSSRSMSFYKSDFSSTSTTSLVSVLEISVISGSIFSLSGFGSVTGDSVGIVMPRKMFCSFFASLRAFSTLFTAVSNLPLATARKSSWILQVHADLSHLSALDLSTFDYRSKWPFESGPHRHSTGT